MKENTKELRIINNPTVSCDIGYGYVKSIGPKGNKKIFPTVYKLHKAEKVEQDINQEYIIKIFEDNGYIQHYAVGDFAKIGFVQKEWSTEQSLNLTNLKIYIGTTLMLHALEDKDYFNEDENGVVNVNLAMGLPIEYFQGQKAALENLMKDLMIDIELRGVRKKFHVDCNTISQQGVGAFYDLLFMPDGEIKTKSELTKTIANCEILSDEKLAPEIIADQILKHGLGIGDIGYNTVDTFYVIKKKGQFVIVDSSAHSFGNKAIYWSHEETVQTLNREYAIDTNVFQFEHALEEADGEIKYGKIVIDTKPYAEKQYKEVADYFISEIKKKWDNYESLGAFVLCGGGAKLIGKYFGFPVLTIIMEDTSFSNARGFHKKMLKLISDLKGKIEKEGIQVRVDEKELDTVEA